MGLVSFSHSSWVASLATPLRSPTQSLARWLRWVMRAQDGQTQEHLAASARRPLGQGVFSAGRCSLGFANQKSPYRDSPSSPSVNRLKIVREADNAVQRGAAGRMMISGRMADVCEELERMVQSEARAVARR